MTYRERIALSPEAELDVRLLDISMADGRSQTIARRTFPNPGQVPLQFTLEYDPAEIDQRMSYAVRAVIRDQNGLMFTTDTVYPVLTRGANDVAELVLVKVARDPRSRPDASLTETYWKLVAIGETPYRMSPKSQQREPHLKLHIQNNLVEGHSSCNQFTGQYELEHGRIVFGALAVTMRACADDYDAERRFLQGLDDMDRFEIEGDELRAYHGEQLLLRFEAVYF